MIETFTLAFATLFATVSPVDVAAIFVAMTATATPQHRRRMAVRGVLVSAGLLLLFAFAGEAVLASMGISLPALKIAGGVLLLLIAIDLVFARDSGGTGATEEEAQEGASKADISVFPLATPLIAGPGAMGAVILLTANAKGDVEAQAGVLLAIVSVMAVTLALLLLANQVQRLLGITGVHVISRVFGIILSALSIQFMLDGLAQSGLF